MSANLERAGRAWGQPLPEWMRALAEACDEGTQARAVRAIGYSPPTVNQVLARTYKGNLEAIEGAVRGAYLAMTVACPVLVSTRRNALDVGSPPLSGRQPLMAFESASSHKRTSDMVRVSIAAGSTPLSPTDRPRPSSPRQNAKSACASSIRGIHPFDGYAWSRATSGSFRSTGSVFQMIS